MYNMMTMVNTAMWYTVFESVKRVVPKSSYHRKKLCFWYLYEVMNVNRTYCMIIL